jgi:hypothetical protein
MCTKLKVGIRTANAFVNSVACCFAYQAKDLSGSPQKHTYTKEGFTYNTMLVLPSSAFTSCVLLYYCHGPFAELATHSMTSVLIPLNRCHCILSFWTNKCGTTGPICTLPCSPSLMTFHFFPLGLVKRESWLLKSDAAVNSYTTYVWEYDNIWNTSSNRAHTKIISLDMTVLFLSHNFFHIIGSIIWDVTLHSPGVHRCSRGVHCPQIQDWREYETSDQEEVCSKHTVVLFIVQPCAK